MDAKSEIKRDTSHAERDIFIPAEIYRVRSELLNCFLLFPEKVTELSCYLYAYYS